jgi:dienelactone hydrolase
MCLAVLLSATALAQPPPALRLPPAGILLSAHDRAELTAAAAAFQVEIDGLTGQLAPNSRLAAFLPDVEVLHKAVDWALRYDEFFAPAQIAFARRLLALGSERAAQLRGGSAPWTEATGVIIRGYRSELDDSVQPYALVVPPDWKAQRGPARRLDVVLSGRNERRTELAFMAEREKTPGQIVPPGAILLYPYGRFCNATKFAGEVDVFEAMRTLRRDYNIDANRMVVRGFSMGGASTWHLTTHYPGTWAASSPGAGFAETAIYAKVFGPDKPPRTWWEQKLWRWYDATAYAANLRDVPTVAYVGDMDPAIDAMRTMEKAVAAEGLKLEMLIGPQTAHKYHPATLATLAGRLDAIVSQGRAEWPSEDHLTTYTLRYARSRRINLMELEKHWERADVDVHFPTPGHLVVRTRNVAVFSVNLQTAGGLKATIDEQEVPLGEITPSYWFVKVNGRWTFQDHTFASERRRGAARKTPGLTGPVDDAFMQPFIFVRPTGKPLNAQVGAWSEKEFAHARKMWRDIFRGDAPVKDDTAITARDLKEKNLILWGDPSSNALLAKMIGQLPLIWDARQLVFRNATYDPAHHAPILIFPNPLGASARYVVLNSGIDFRDEAYGTNSLQTPKLPDYAIVDLREMPGPRWPGKIVTAGFFDESWK